MSIFDFSKRPPEISGDWKIFQKFYGSIGVFTYSSEYKTAYFDDTATHMLSCRKNTLSEFEFFNLLEKISGSPAEGHEHIYTISDGFSVRFIKMNIYESSGRWLGFVQDFTRQLSEAGMRQTDEEYEPIMRLPSYTAFSKKVKKLLPEMTCCFLASVCINGIDKLSSFLSVDTVNECITSVCNLIKSFSGENVIMGSKSGTEIFVMFTDCDRRYVTNLLTDMDSAVRECVLTDDFGEVIDISDKCSLSLSAGCCCYPDDARDFNTFVSYSGFALYEARTRRHSCVNWFSEKNYLREKDSYRKTQIFSKIIHDNLLSYCFQPIVDAVSGEVYGYELLMRVSGDVKISPREILSIARRQNILYSIEKLTFFNSARIIEDNREIFGPKKLFINSMSEYTLTDDDFNELYVKYGSFLENVVSEITESSDVSPSENISNIKKRAGIMGSRLAVDNFGAGRSNISNLLRYKPDYVKVDRCLISGIDSDSKKQQFFAQITEFCHDNRIQCIAVGVETSPELRTVIRLGADFVQGFYISKPSPSIQESIPTEVRDEIININLDSRKSGRKIYSARSDSEIDILKLALERYTDIHVYRSKLTIYGDVRKPVKMNISIMDNYSCELTLKNTNIISGNGKPVISVGEYARLILDISRTNKLSGSGICVPSGSQLAIKGKGSLSLVSENSGIGIGNSTDSGFGDISVNMTGNLDISCSGDSVVCIGGGFGGGESEINLISGDISLGVSAKNGTAIGAVSGDTRITANKDCNLDIVLSGTKTVGIGSESGELYLDTSANISMAFACTHCTGIGVSEKGSGEIIIDGGNVKIRSRCATQVCVGTSDGHLSTLIKNADIEIDAEGDSVTAIGDTSGDGDISVENSELKMKILSRNPNEIVSQGKVKLNNCEILSEINGKISDRL